MTWNEVAAIIIDKMNQDEGRETARVETYLTRMAFGQLSSQLN